MFRFSGEVVLGSAVTTGGLVAWAATSSNPLEFSMGTALCAFAGVLMTQGLIRDVSVILGRRRARARVREGAENPGSPPPRVGPALGPEFNLCMESTLGVTLLAMGALYTFFPDPPSIAVPPGLVLAGAGLVLVLGWGIRDWIFTVRWVENHYDLPVYRSSPDADPGATKDS